MRCSPKFQIFRFSDFQIFRFSDFAVLKILRFLNIYEFEHIEILEILMEDSKTKIRRFCRRRCHRRRRRFRRRRRASIRPWPHTRTQPWLC